MNFEKTITVIDSHTQGEAARLVIGGIPKLKGTTVAEKKQYLKEKKDYLRTTLMHEPRGHDNMFGAILVETDEPTADFGIIFMDGGGYLNMCGHNTIAAVTIAIETGMIELDGRTVMSQNVVLDTPAGLVYANAKIDNGRVDSVSFKNVASFLYKTNLKVTINGLGEITYDIAFGGSFFIMVNVEQLPFSISTENTALFAKWGKIIRSRVNSLVDIQHPILNYINTADLVEFYEEGKQTATTYFVKNVVFFGNMQLDRSPCGTGTSAKIATLYAKNQLNSNQTLISESIIGTTFKGKVTETIKVSDEYSGIIPEISGSAYITGMHQFFIDPNDPLKYGFELK